MVKGKTGTGFEFSVDETLLQNYRFVKRLAHVAKNDYSEFFDLFTEILVKVRRRLSSSIWKRKTDRLRPSRWRRNSQTSLK